MNAAIGRRFFQLPARVAAVGAPSIPLAVLLIFLLHAPVVIFTGVKKAGDTASYAYWSQRIIDSGFDYPALLAEAETGFPALLYALFATLLALLRLIWSEDWMRALVVLNFAAHIAIGVMLVRLAVLVTASGAAGWTALALFLASHELLNWVSFVLSDATFLFLAFFTFSLAARRILGIAQGWLAVIPTAAAGIFYRPTGIVLVPDLVLAGYLSRKRGLFLNRRALGAGVVAAVLVVTGIFAWFMQDPARWPFDALSNAFANTSRDYQLGEVVKARRETYHAPPSAVLDYMLISADRFVHFFAIGAFGYVTGHWLVSILFFVPCYLLAGWTLIALWRGDVRLDPRRRKVLLVSLGAVLSYAWFHGLVQVDFDWRYRLPILPHLILLAAAGAADLARRAQTA